MPTGSAETTSAAATLGVSAPEGTSYAGLVWTLIRTDFKVRYHGSAGGFVWALLKPLTMFVMLMAVFSFVFGADPHYKLNLIIGLFLWDFFAEGTKTGLTSLSVRGFLLTKARCPAWILVVTSISNAVLTLSVFVAIILVFLAGAGNAPSLGAAALFVLYCLALILIVIGFSLGTSVLFLRYRDLNQIWDVIAQAGFFVAPIIYPIGILPERYHLYLYLWAPTPVVQFSRQVLVSGPAPTVRADMYLLLAVVLCLGVGTMLYRMLVPRAAEYA